MRNPFAALTIFDVAPEIGARVDLEPEFQFVGEIIFKNGRRHLFRNTNFNINPAGSVEICKDKGYTNYFLRKKGFRTPTGRAFFSESLNANLAMRSQRGVDEAIAYAHQIGYPVFVKPNNLSQGTLVCKVRNDDELRAVAAQIFERTAVMLVEEKVSGRDYRVVVLDGQVISAYERCPLLITGDGRHTIAELLAYKKLLLETKGRPNAEICLDDFRIDATLQEYGLNRTSILESEQPLRLLDNANLSTGGEAVDVTNQIHPDYKRLAVQASKALGLILCGVDIMCPDLTQPMKDYTIIELNAAPGLDNYASIGPEQHERVRDLYRTILRYLEKMTDGALITA